MSEEEYILEFSESRNYSGTSNHHDVRGDTVMCVQRSLVTIQLDRDFEYLVNSKFLERQIGQT